MRLYYPLAMSETHELARHTTPEAPLPPALLTPIDDDATRRQFLAALGATGLLTACGTDTIAPGTAATTREVVDGTGRTVVIPADPQRILVISRLSEQSQLVDLGVTPYALFNTSSPVDRMPPALRGVVESAQLVGSGTGEVDAEQITLLAPDLILHNQTYGGIDTAVVQRIAPTISFDTEPGGYEVNMRRLAGWLDRTAEADAAIARWNDRLAELAAELNLGGRTFSALFPYTDIATFQLQGPESDLGRVVTALGGTIVPAEVGGEPLTEISVELSYEVLPEVVEADTILLLRYYDPGNDEAFGEFLADPLWQSIDAVVRGDVIEIDVQDAGANHGYDGLEAVARTIAGGLAPQR